MEEIDLKDLFSYFWNKILLIILIVFIAIGVSVVYQMSFKTPLYKSYTTLVLARSEDSSESSQSSSITQSEITINQNLVSIYKEIIVSRRVLDKVISSLNLDYTIDELTENISVTALNDTEILKITVINEDPALAKKIANKISDVFCEEIIKIFSIKNLAVIDTAIESTQPYNINYIKDTAIGCMIGLVLGVGIVFVMFYFDTTIKSSEELEQKLGVTVLGVVPKSSRGGRK